MRTLLSSRGWIRLAGAATVLGIALVGCSASPPKGLAPVALVSHVDLNRFMGDWFVIANIPTFLEKGAYNAKDTYALDPDGSVATVYSFNADAFDGPRKQYHSRGFVVDRTSNAVWGQQYVWPFRADYRISYLAPDYSTTVIAREKRDFVWIMARTPTISEAEYDRLVGFVKAQGYDISRLQRSPQSAGNSGAR
ncbi:MAG: lipocalin family protein [Proteobacteria bacterium]|nr:lipocalin family protein [Pseudomonadota bacterium]